MNVSLSPYDGSMILKKDVMKRFQASFVSASLVEAHFWAAAAVECHCRSPSKRQRCVRLAGQVRITIRICRRHVQLMLLFTNLLYHPFSTAWTLAILAVDSYLWHALSRFRATLT